MQKLSSNALTVLKSRYLLKNGKFLETPEQMFDRVALYVAGAENKFEAGADPEHWRAKFYSVMTELLFLPNSPTLMNAGTQNNQLSACFVLPIRDNTDSIFETLRDAALIQRSGGGTGFNFSNIRPENDVVSFPGYKASGPVSFMKIYDEATEQIRQGGKRRGANMGILTISHPDIEKFIRAKNEEGILKNFNISVGVTDAFMRAARENRGWNLINPRTGKTTKVVKAKLLWNKIIRFAHKTGDPGIVFLDTINKFNPTPLTGTLECTNPCGEVPLLDYEACTLGSVNLSRMVKGGKMNWKLLEETVFTAVRFLDNVIEVNDYILPQIEQVVKGNRKIGLGVMGWAELLILLNIPYASEKAVTLAARIMKFIRDKSDAASAKLAIERGVFPNWEKSVFYPNRPLRNATRTSIAPTGTLSIIADTTPSIEPLFAISYRRENVLEGKTLYEMNPLLMGQLKKKTTLSDKNLLKITQSGSLKNIPGISSRLRRLFLNAHEINYLFHVKHQIAFQKYTDNAVSKTINLSRKATIADVEKAFLYTWKHGAKGITIFRDGSRKLQVLRKGKDKQLSAIEQCGVCES